MNICLEQEEVEKLKEMAKDNDLSMSSMLGKLILQSEKPKKQTEAEAININGLSLDGLIDIIIRVTITLHKGLEEKKAITTKGLIESFQKNWEARKISY